MTIEFKDISGELVSEADMRQALVAMTRMLLDVKLAGALGPQILCELPNVLRCINELHALRAGLNLPIAFTVPAAAAEQPETEDDPSNA